MSLLFRNLLIIFHYSPFTCRAVPAQEQNVFVPLDIESDTDYFHDNSAFEKQGE